MARRTTMDTAMAASLLGMQQPGGVAGAFVIARVMYTLAPWSMPEGAALEAARTTARKYRLADDLAAFLPPEPGRLAGRARKEEYQGLVIALKNLDALPAEERATALADVYMLLGPR